MISRTTTYRVTDPYSFFNCINENISMYIVRSLNGVLYSFSAFIKSIHKHFIKVTKSSKIISNKSNSGLSIVRFSRDETKFNLFRRRSGLFYVGIE